MNYWSCLLVGDYGTGKTTAASTAPKPILFLDVDNKLHKMENLRPLLRSKAILQWPIVERLSEFGLTRLATMDPKPGTKVTVAKPKGYTTLAGMVEKLEESKCVVDGVKYETVVLDSYTSVDEHVRRLLMAVNGSNTMTKPLFGALLTNFEELNNTLLRLPANIIFICHESPDKDDLTGKITIKPLIWGSMHNKIGKDFEEVYAMLKTFKGGEPKYEMLTIGDSMRAGRTSRNIPARVEPNFQRIYGGDYGKIKG